MQALSLEFKLHQLGDAPALLPASVGKTIGLLVLLAFVSEGIWRLARHISVIAHEGAHALAGWSMGRKVVGVRLNSDATGETAIQGPAAGPGRRSEEHTSELQSLRHLVCRLLLEKKKKE